LVLGLLCSFDTVTPEVTNKLKSFAYDKDMLIISCGTQTVRFRPVLDSKKEHFDIAARILRDALVHIDRETKKASL
jgi:L-lysine 6-transaminase